MVFLILLLTKFFELCIIVYESFNEERAMNRTHWIFTLGVVFFVLPLTVTAQPAYQFLPDVRVNSDPVSTYYHTTGFTNGHSIGSYQGAPFVLWAGDQEDGIHPHIYLSKSTDGGGTFLPPVRVDRSGGIYSARYPSLLIDTTGVIYAAWMDSSTSIDHLYVARSTDGGGSFTLPVRADSNGGLNPQLPALAVNSRGTLYVTWSGWQDSSRTASNIYLAKSTDGGLTFSPAALVDSTLNLRATASNIAADTAGTLFLVWRDNRSGSSYYHVYFCKSTDGGNTFTPAVEVDLPGPYSGTFPSLAVDRTGQYIYCAYKERDTGIHHIYLSKSSDGGLSFGGRIQTDSTGESDTPNLAFREPDRLYLIWKDTRGGGFGDAYFSYSTDQGANFSPEQRVNTPPISGVLYPHVTFGPGDTVYTCWTDLRNSSSYPDIYFAKGIPDPTGANEEDSEMKSVELEIQGPFPNPITDRLQIHFTRRTEGLVSLSIYDLQGRNVWQTSALCKPGTPYRFTWLFESSKEHKASSGIYFLRWQTFGSQASSKRGVMKFIIVK